MATKPVADLTMQGQRDLALDRLRGLIVVLMALDHANYFVAQRHSTGEHWGGDFPAYTDALSFLTRLVTHPVAPGFTFRDTRHRAIRRHVDSRQGGVAALAAGRQCLSRPDGCD